MPAEAMGEWITQDGRKVTDRANQELLNFAQEHNVTPHRCPRCRQAEGNWHYGWDNGRDPNWLGYECQQCGKVVDLSARWIKRKGRAK